MLKNVLELWTELSFWSSYSLNTTKAYYNTANWSFSEKNKYQYFSKPELSNYYYPVQLFIKGC